MAASRLRRPFRKRLPSSDDRTRAHNSVSDASNENAPHERLPACRAVFAFFGCPRRRPSTRDAGFTTGGANLQGLAFEIHIVRLVARPELPGQLRVRNWSVAWELLRSKPGVPDQRDGVPTGPALEMHVVSCCRLSTKEPASPPCDVALTLTFAAGSACSRFFHRNCRAGNAHAVVGIVRVTTGALQNLQDRSVHLSGREAWP